MKCVLALAFATVAFGQQIDLGVLDKIADRAKSKVNVTLNEDQLKFAGAFLSNDDPNQEVAKGLIGGLKSINVRVFEFEKAGSYAMSDVEPIRIQLKAPGWSKLVEAREGDEVAEVYMFTKGKTMGGITVIAGEKRELVVVNIVGPIDLNSLGSLAGKFGIPKDVMGGGPAAPKQVAPRKPGAAAPKQD